MNEKTNTVYEVTFNSHTGKWETFIAPDYGSQNIVNVDHENSFYWFRTIADSHSEAFDRAYKAITEKHNSNPHKSKISDARDRAWTIKNNIADVLDQTDGKGDGFNTPDKESYWSGVVQGLSISLSVLEGYDKLNSSLREVVNPIPYGKRPQ